MGLYDFARGFGRAYKRRVGGGGGGGGKKPEFSKQQRFKTSCITVRLKKMLFNFTRSFKLQNIVKNRFHFNTS